MPDIIITPPPVVTPSGGVDANGMLAKGLLPTVAAQASVADRRAFLGVLGPRDQPVRNVATLGHSFIEQTYAGPTSDSQRGVAYWAGVLSQGRLRFDYSRMFGKAGDTAGYYDAARPGFTSRLDAALASDADILLVSGVTNDFAVGVPFADTVAAMTRIAGSARDRGKLPVTWVETPRGGANVLSAAGLLRQARYMNWLRANAAQVGFVVADATYQLHDPSVAGFDSLSGIMVADKLHFAIPGAKALGRAIVDVLAGALSPFDVLTYNGADLYNADDNPGGNLVANAPMRGTGGSTSAGGATISGSVADGWQVLIANGAGLTVVCNVVTRAGRRFQEVQVSGTPTAGNPSIWVRQTPAFAGQIAAGDQLSAQGYGELDASSSGITGFGIEQWTGDAGGNHAMRTGNSVGSAINGFYPADAHAGVFRTMPNPTGANPTTFYAQYGMQGINGTAITATMRWSNLEIRKG